MCLEETEFCTTNNTAIFDKRYSISACSNNNPNSYLPLWAIDIGTTPSIGYSDKKEIPLSCSICDCNRYNFCLDETNYIFEMVAKFKEKHIKLLMQPITYRITATVYCHHFESF